MSSEVDRLREIVAKLRGPDGCPWDREQTHATLRSSLIEEAYEVVEAIDSGDDAHFREELGDLLLQVVMHAQLASETCRFDFETVAAGISEKLIRRHPHVFGDNKVGDSKAVLKQWDEIKRQEKGSPSSVLANVSQALPALMRAEKIQKRAAQVGFDWPDAAGPLEKVAEELEESREALAAGERAAIEEEIGDLLFAAVNLARKAQVDPELALSAATRKFSDRFQKLEKLIEARGETLADLTLEQLDLVWDEVKQ